MVGFIIDYWVLDHVTGNVVNMSHVERMYESSNDDPFDPSEPCYGELVYFVYDTVMLSCGIRTTPREWEW